MLNPTTLIDPDRFWAKVDKADPDGCWPWLGNIDRYGYGCTDVSIDGKRYFLKAHRVAYEIGLAPIGSIPAGYEIDHLCFHPACVNPSHLEPVTPAENKARRRGTRRIVDAETGAEVCAHGHLMDPPESYAGKRYCRTCKNASKTRQRENWSAEQKEREKERLRIKDANRPPRIR